MPHFGHARYVPILACQPGELRALRELSPGRRAQITPLIELAPSLGLVGDTACQLEQLRRELGSGWQGRNIWVDVLDPQARGEATGGVHPLLQLRAQLPQVVPVVYLDSDAALLRALGAPTLCLRVWGDEPSDLPRLSKRLLEFLRGAAVQPEQVHLLFDFAAISPERQAVIVALIPQLLEELPLVQRWASLTMSASSTPVFAALRPGSLSRHERQEWSLWQTLQDRPLARSVQFSDYGVTPPLPPGAAPLSSAEALICYTTPQHLLVLKGHSLYTHPRRKWQWADLCALLTGHPDFGIDTGAGDTLFHDCAQGHCAEFDASAWQRASVGHHLNLVAAQLAGQRLAPVGIPQTWAMPLATA